MSNKDEWLIMRFREGCAEYLSDKSISLIRTWGDVSTALVFSKKEARQWVDMSLKKKFGRCIAVPR